MCIYAFDCMYLNGVNLMGEPLLKRREALYSAFQEVPGEFHFAVAKVSRDVEELQVFLEDSIVENTEARGGVENKRSADVESTNRVRASV